MVVIAPNTMLGVRRQTTTRDGYGTVRSSGHGNLGNTYPGRVVSEPVVDGDLETGPGVWVLAVDERLLPLQAGDWLCEPGRQGRSWAVQQAAHRPSPGTVGYVRVETTLISS